jgi:hypothetical protein
MTRAKSTKETIKFSCGHTVKVQIEYTSREDLERKIEWRETQGVCPECWKRQQEEERQQASREAAAEAMKQGLPSLQGSPKQIAWAESIRSELLAAISEEIESVKGALLEGVVVPLLEKSHAKVATETSANWFINKGRFFAHDPYSLAAIATPDAEEVIGAAEDQILIQRVTPDDIKAIGSLRTQIAEKQAELEAAQASARAAQTESEKEGSEYRQLKEESDSWTDEQIEGTWTEGMYTNAHRRDAIEASWGWARVDDIRQQLGSLKNEESKLVKALSQQKPRVVEYLNTAVGQQDSNP